MKIFKVTYKVPYKCLDADRLVNDIELIIREEAPTIDEALKITSQIASKNGWTIKAIEEII